MKKTLLSIPLFISLALCACADSGRERVSRMVKEWEGKEIVFPEHSVFTVQGKDTVSCPSGSSSYRILTYVDSVGCTSCKLQLPRWKELIAEFDSAADGKVSFLFYFHPKDKNELRYLTRRDDFTYPVCFDESDELNRLNIFLGNMTFQTFLLDSDNRVVAIGNPIHNSDVKRLYLRIVTGDAPSVTDKPIETTATLDLPVVDFGRFSYTESQEKKVILRNTGSHSLVIHGINTSCGCTRVEYGKRPIVSGDEISLRVIYRAEEKGHFRKTVDVYCNTPDSPLRLVVTGMAE